MPTPPPPARRPLPPLPPRPAAGARPGAAAARPAAAGPGIAPARQAGAAASRPAVLPHPGRPGVVRPRPDPTGLRIALGFGGVAAASALAAALLAPVTGGAPATVATSAVTADAGPIQRDTVYIQLLPGQTAPPNANVANAPAPTPRVVVVTTRQSGVKK